MSTPTDSFDDLFTITCGKCKATSPLLRWCDGLSSREFKCPACDYRFMRLLKPDAKAWEPFYEIVEIKNS